MSDKLKLNLGCASNPIEGYVNIDQDSLQDMKDRYPEKNFPDWVEIYQHDIFDLPYEEGAVDEILADGFLEHLSFIEEKKFFDEMKRVLKPGGILSVSVPNFEKVVRFWLEAEDDWKEFYRLDDEAINKKHWFGTYTYEPTNRWGYLLAMIYGSQHGEGQYHQNCYTVSKIKSILKYMGLEEVSIEEFQWKGDRDPMIRFIAKKLG